MSADLAIAAVANFDLLDDPDGAIRLDAEIANGTSNLRPTQAKPACARYDPEVASGAMRCFRGARVGCVLLP
jgi:hypothetical protein